EPAHRCAPDAGSGTLRLHWPGSGERWGRSLGRPLQCARGLHHQVTILDTCREVQIHATMQVHPAGVGVVQLGPEARAVSLEEHAAVRGAHGDTSDLDKVAAERGVVCYCLHRSIPPHRALNTEAGNLLFEGLVARLSYEKNIILSIYTCKLFL